jgi:hypothetical protein
VNCHHAPAFATGEPGAITLGRVLKIHELTDSDGRLSSMYLRALDGALEVVDASGALPVPAEALERVLARYGAPFDAEAEITEVAVLELGSARRLRHVRHLAGYDVVPRDYLVLEGDGLEPLCAMAATVAGALMHLARAARSLAPA